MKNLIVALPFALAALVACSGEKKEEAAPAAPAAPAEAAPTPPPPAAPAADPKAEADTVFAQRCVTCHGASGKGDGIAAANLNPKPRDYTDAEWQKSVTDDYLGKVILEGGPAVGKSPLMTANPDLKDKPEVVKALVAKVRSFSGAASGAAGTVPAAPAPAAK